MKKYLFITLTALSMLTFSSCGILNHTEKSSEEAVVKETKIDELDITVEVGSCNISYGDTEYPEIKAEYKVKADSDKKASEAIEQIKLNYEAKDGVLEIGFDVPEKKLGNNPEIETNVKVILPEKEYKYKITSDVGSINLNGLEGNFDLKSDVGSITLDDISITGESEVSADVGSIEAGLKEIENADVKFKAGVGDISLNMNGIEYEEESSDKDVTKESKTISINGNSTIEMKTGVGDINIK